VHPSETVDFCQRAFKQARNGFICMPCRGGWVMRNLDSGKETSCYPQASPTICLLSSALARGNGVCVPSPANKSRRMTWTVFRQDGSQTGAYATKDACYSSF
jgi:hypothetical protein